jgi:hypothetical protein
MDSDQPHAEAAYRVVQLDGGAFGVEVLIPGTYPTMVTGLGNQRAAEAWIANHQQLVRAKPSVQRPSLRFHRAPR